MTPSTAAPAAAGSQAVSRPTGLAHELALVRSGQATLGAMMDRAQQLQEAGQADGAVALYEAWLAHTPGAAMRQVAFFNLGTALVSLNRHAEAEQAYLKALEISPDFIQARLNLGHQCERQNRPDEALTQWRHVLSLPNVPQDLRLHALNNSARLCETQRRYDQAESLMRDSLLVKPDQGDVLQHYVHMRQKKCAWPVYQPVGDVTPNQMLTSTSPMAMLGANDDPALHLMAAHRFAHERVPKAPAVPLHKTRPPRSGKIKIAYLSGDLCMHAVGLLTVELLELHDRERFEVWAFSWSREDGTPLRARIRNAFDHYVPLAGVDDASAARMIADAGIDIVVDLQGLTNGARPAILGHRAAPIQASYLGFVGTSGLPGVDWIIADRFLMPEELLPFSTEKPIYLPNCYQVSDRKREIGAKPTRAQYTLPEDAFVFCSFNNNFKFTEEVFRSWMRILQQVDNSVLWLLADNEWARDNMLREAASHGVAAERLIFAPRVAPPDYLARFQLADLMLDTFPYNAGTTASDALWMGLPIVTLSGRTAISRMAGSLLSNVGLPDLVTFSLADYERLAVQLGQNPLRVASYKRYLAEHGHSSPLFDVPAMVRDMDNELERLALAHRAAA
jgi:predicted O-linked N-acetylglucosamine transferase (SPINDLY family)